MTTLRNHENGINSVEDSVLTNSDTCSTPGMTESLILQNMGNSMMPGYYIYCASEYDDIVRRIIRILISPDTAIGFLEGIKSVPVDLFYLGRAYLDTENRYRNENEHYRLALLIKRGLSDEDLISNLIHLIFEELLIHTPENTQNKIFSRIGGAMFGRMATNSLVAGKIARIVMQNIINAASSTQLRAILSIKASFTGAIIGNILLIGGMAERAVYTAQALKEDCPEIYNKLRPKDLDLLYFFVESLMEPIVDAINIRRTDGQAAFEKIMGMVADELQKE
ncbi:hypothetical protein QMI71_002977 [Salmonella enterica]|uniref:hypothetical protein n=1 Tax=Salmonella enterica TaxID=28901 RepID=UPI0009ACC80C|nr:hypothetical protein [Salmonella enterica]ELW2864680.1 hypothetical protein [Salmonella enterica]